LISVNDKTHLSLGGQKGMNLENNKPIAIITSIITFNILMLIGAMFMSPAWFVAAIFFVFLPVSHEVARRVTGVKIMEAVFK
jgi:hypothetical protein